MVYRFCDITINTDDINACMGVVSIVTGRRAARIATVAVDAALLHPLPLPPLLEEDDSAGDGANAANVVFPWAPRGDQYRGLERDELVDTLVVRDARLEVLSDNEILLKNKIRRLEHKLVVANAKTGDLRAQAQLVLNHVMFRVGLRNVSLEGGYTLAVRRNQGGTVGRAAAILMMAGDGLAGGFKDPHVIRTSY